MYGNPDGVGIFKSKMTENKENLIMLTRDDCEFIRRDIADEESKEGLPWEFEAHRNVSQYAERRSYENAG